MVIFAPTHIRCNPAKSSVLQTIIEKNVNSILYVNLILIAKGLKGNPESKMKGMMGGTVEQEPSEHMLGLF